MIETYDITLFWIDSWLDGLPIETLAPNLFKAVPPRFHSRTVRDGLLNGTWISDIKGPLSEGMVVEYVEVWEKVRQVALTAGVEDKFRWRWSSDGNYSLSSAYHACFIGSVPFLGAKFIWKASVPPKVKFFAWLAAQDRCWTAVRRHRHGLQDDNVCALCDQEAESINHLLLHCSFSKHVWFLALQKLAWHSLLPDPGVSLMEWWCSVRGKVVVEQRSGFDAVILLVVWTLWKERNARVFDGKCSSPHDVLSKLLSEARLWDLAGFQAFSRLVSWLPSPTVELGLGLAVGSQSFDVN
ncbi:hypothetical protein U9M48_018027 [Paspalum notatum var. saurae]|uniref:Reverse transcriptase zinc-binding domain-containing protein n=1 Tax=Paspalum notatum var. saurae TaxID=547442 RepID=A0AAQ3T9A5_PASNO